ncbi:MAG: hypothetical protein ONB23_05700 [candidate division KSB1 bacterium]|nr:hypothetical protein [candidate division KSB1 bacterium]
MNYGKVARLVVAGAMVVGTGGARLTQAQWTRLNGPYSDMISCLAAGPQGLFAGTYGHGVFRSLDGGRTWESISQGIEYLDVQALGALPAGLFASVWYAGAGYLYMFDPGSETWLQVGTLSLPGDVIKAFIQVGGTIVCGTYSGQIYRSRDGGLQWEPGGQTHTIECFAMIDSALFAGTWGGGLYVSPDTGKTWECLGGVDFNVYVSSLLAMGRTLYIAFGDCIYTYELDQRVWTKLAEFPAATGWSALASLGTRIYWAMPFRGVFLSMDSGRSWQPRDLSGVDVWHLVSTPGNLVAGTHDLGVFTSLDDGSTWTQTGLLPHSFLPVVLAMGSNVFCAMQEGLMISRDAGESFTEFASLSHTRVTCLHRRGSDLLAGGGPSAEHGGGVFKSGDVGRSWSQIGLMDRDVTCIGHLRNWLFVGTGASGVFRTGNDGSTWQAVNNGLPATRISSVAVIDTMVFVGSDGFSGGVYRSHDYGSHWAAYGLADTGVLSLVAIGSQLLAATTAGLMRHSPALSGWTCIAFKDTLVTQLLYGGGLVLALTESDVFASEDSGRTWRKVNRDGLTEDCVPQSVAIEAQWVYLGTAWQGLWRRNLSEVHTGLPHRKDGIPRVVHLDPCFPNPFNPSTTIAFELPHRAQVLLTVLDSRGRLVATLISGEREAGRYAVQWDASGLAAGMYLCRLAVQGRDQAGSALVETRKMILAK